MSKIKNRQRPLYKKLQRLQINLFRRAKVLSFKKKKWLPFIAAYKKTLRDYVKNPWWRVNRQYFKPRDFVKYSITRYANHKVSYKRRYSNILLMSLMCRLYYGGFRKKYFKQQIKKSKKIFNLQTGKKVILLPTIFIRLFESRLDSVLFKAKFAFSTKSARQLILHGKVLVNNKVVKSNSYSLKEGDLVEIVPTFQNCKQILFNLSKSKSWPVPPKHLLVNYRTMQIIVGNMEKTNMSLGFDTHLHVNKLTLYYLKR